MSSCTIITIKTSLRPYFFENYNGNTVTVNAECYANMLVTFGLPWIDENDPNEETFFQQDGATSHTANILMNLLRHSFPGRLISGHGDIPWPTRSLNLTALDFFLWSYGTSNPNCSRKNLQ